MKTNLLGDTMVANGLAESTLSSLPPEVWALILEHLPFQCVQSCMVISQPIRFTLHEAVPSVRSLSIDRPSDTFLRGGTIDKFRGVREITFVSAFTSSDDDLPTAMMVLPFICQFPLLERVSFGTTSSSGDFRLGVFPRDEERLGAQNSECIKRLMDAFSCAYRAGDIPGGVMARGLYCPRTYNQSGALTDPGCSACRRLLRAMPISQVIQFDSCVSSSEAQNIIEARPGGLEYVRSEAYFLQLLGCGACEKRPLLRFPQTIHIAGYSDHALSEMERLMHDNHVDILGMSALTITRARAESFAEMSHGQCPPEELCFIEEASFVRLKRMGLPINEEDLLSPFISDVSGIDHLHLAIRRMKSGSRVMQHISAHCIHELLPNEQYSSAVARGLISSDALPTLVEFLQQDELYPKADAARIFAYLACLEWSEEVVSAGAVPHLVRLLGSADEDCYSNAAYAIFNMLNQGLRDVVRQAGALEPLVRLLGRPHSGRSLFGRPVSRPTVNEQVIPGGVKALVDLCCAEPLESTATLDDGMVKRLVMLCMSTLDWCRYAQQGEDVLKDALQLLCFVWPAHPEPPTTIRTTMLPTSCEAHRCEDIVRWLRRCKDLSESMTSLVISTLETIRKKDPLMNDCIICRWPLSNPLYMVVEPRTESCPPLLKVLVDGSDVIKSHACSLISSIVSEDPNRVKLLIRAGYVKTLLGLSNKELLGQTIILRHMCRFLNKCNLSGDDLKVRMHGLYCIQIALENVRGKKDECAAIYSALLGAGMHKEFVEAYQDHLQAITAMEQKSFEELRLEDYMAGNKGTKGQAAPAAAGLEDLGLRIT